MSDFQPSVAVPQPTFKPLYLTAAVDICIVEHNIIHTFMQAALVLRLMTTIADLVS